MHLLGTREDGHQGSISHLQPTFPESTHRFWVYIRLSSRKSLWIKNARVTTIHQGMCLRTGMAVSRLCLTQIELCFVIGYSFPPHPAITARCSCTMQAANMQSVTQNAASPQGPCRIRVYGHRQSIMQERL